MCLAWQPFTSHMVVQQLSNAGWGKLVSWQSAWSGNPSICRNCEEPKSDRFHFAVLLIAHSPGLNLLSLWLVARRLKKFDNVDSRIIFFIYLFTLMASIHSQVSWRFHLWCPTELMPHTVFPASALINSNNCAQVAVIPAARLQSLCM